MRYLAALFGIFALLLVVIIFTLIILEVNLKPNNLAKFGITFSPDYATYLKLDWKKTYLDILDNLKVKNLRLTSYWDLIEKTKDKFDFSQPDFLLSEAKKRGVRVLLVVGARQPRWPECHYPSWAKDQTVLQRQQETLDLIQRVVERYKNNPSIWAYQVENEPLAWWFGQGCDSPDSNFLQTEVNLVKSLDKKPVVITDSGEWSLWIRASQKADIFGSSVYRKAYNSNLHFYMTYPFPASYYKLKADLINKKVIVTELQAEAWIGKDQDLSPESESKAFSLNEFKNNVDFVKKIGFSEDYLWGVEWWYFMAKNNHSEYLEYAKTLF